MKKRNLLLVLILALAVSCTSSTDKPKAGHVILIGIDGWGAYSMEKAEVPAIRQLMENGSYTLKKRSVLPSSSAVNWASMFMGAGPELHGYTEWDSKVPELPSRELNHHGIFPTVFQLFRDAHPEAEIGCVYDWDGIKYLVDTLSLSYHAQGPNYDQEPDVLTEMAVKYIKEKKPDFFAVVFDKVDHVGHGEGHDTPAYYQALEETDRNIRKIVEAVEEAGILDETVFIVSSDHGGLGKGHGGKTMLEMETPFIISGKGIKKGYCFDSISMMQYDCASTIARLLGLSQPQVWIGRPMPVFESDHDSSVH